MTPSFTQPTPEDGKVLAFARDIRLDLLTYIVVVQPEWLIPADVEVLQAEEMEALLARLAPGHPRLPQDSPRTERVSAPRASLAPLSLLHQLMVSPFLFPSTAWHMMHAKADTMGMIQWVAPFLDWLRAAKIEPLQGIATLTSVKLTDAMLEQLQGIRTNLVPPPLHLQPPIQHIPLKQPLQMQARPHHQLPKVRR